MPADSLVLCLLRACLVAVTPFLLPSVVTTLSCSALVDACLPAVLANALLLVGTLQDLLAVFLVESNCILLSSGVLQSLESVCKSWRLRLPAAVKHSRSSEGSVVQQSAGYGDGGPCQTLH